ncbi:MAG: hypothetical protein K5925_03915, partial [Bacilli bacterium]|nr:hypothetical protein [Bacilli bacterium]
MRTLILYFSYEGAIKDYILDKIEKQDRGYVEKAAEHIRTLTGGDIFKVTRKKPYPDDFEECIKVMNKEMEEKSLPELKDYLTDIKDYDLIYVGSHLNIGYPNYL